MFEFRWLECDDKDEGAVHIEGPKGNRDYYAKLQVRHQVGPRGETWWDEWQDVPLVAA